MERVSLCWQETYGRSFTKEDAKALMIFKNAEILEIYPMKSIIPKNRRYGFRYPGRG